jgi:hypothetical protein
MRVPAENPTPSRSVVELKGSLNDFGKLTLHARLIERGDAEIFLRNVFRRVPSTQWKTLLLSGLSLSGLRNAEISDIKSADPADTSKPFEVAFDISVPNYLDTSSKQAQFRFPMAQPPLPRIYEEDAKTSQPIDLGLPKQWEYRLRLQVPEGRTFRLPLALSLKHDYGEYEAKYSMDGNNVTAERTVTVRWRQLPPERLQDFPAFENAARADMAQALILTGDHNKPVGTEKQDPEELHKAGLDALKNNNYKRAADLFQRVVELDPKHKFAWNNLGRA